MEIVLLNGQTWLVCGGRDFSDQRMFDTIMAHLVSTRGCPAKIVHGSARGADTMADAWGKRMAVDVVPVPADWKKDGNAAGPIRNENMLIDHKPDLVVAFPGGNGTADMVKRARKRREVDVVEVQPIDQVLANARDAQAPTAR